MVGKKKKKPPVNKNLSPQKRPDENLEELPSEEGSPSGRVDRRKELASAAKKAQGRLLPSGYTVDRYLGETQDRWNRLINPDAKKNLTEDVNSLIRDYLRRTIRSLRSAPSPKNGSPRWPIRWSKRPYCKNCPLRNPCGFTFSFILPSFC